MKKGFMILIVIFIGLIATLVKYIHSMIVMYQNHQIANRECANLYKLAMLSWVVTLGYCWWLQRIEIFWTKNLYHISTIIIIIANYTISNMINQRCGMTTSHFGKTSMFLIIGTYIYVISKISVDFMSMLPTR